jgi:hypothetical protein
VALAALFLGRGIRSTNRSIRFVIEEGKGRRLVPGEGNSEPGGDRGCLGSAYWGFLSALHYETGEGVAPTVRVAVVEEDLWSFCRILGDLDDVAVSSARAAALEGAFSTHGEIRRLGKCQRQRDRTGQVCKGWEMQEGYLLKD